MEQDQFPSSTFETKIFVDSDVFFLDIFVSKEKDFVSSRHPSNWVKHFPDAAEPKAV